MGLINCPECGKEISDQAPTCPGCGMKIKKKKPIWIIVIAAIFAVIAIFVLFDGMRDFKQSFYSSKSSPISEKYYMGMSGYHVYVIYFNDKNTAEIVDSGLGRDQDKRLKAYGTYSINEESLIISLSGGEKLNCIIKDTEESIIIEGEEFSPVAEEEISEKTLQCFDKFKEDN